MIPDASAIVAIVFRDAGWAHQAAAMEDAEVLGRGGPTLTVTDLPLVDA